MVAQRYGVGDVVFSRVDIHNDGGVPDFLEGELLARAGARGIVVRVSAARDRSQQPIYLVRFEGADEMLGPPIGCLDEELTPEPADDAGIGRPGGRAR
ncbi:MAG TPA: nitrogen fixation protein NifZ [Polyangiaceae bacterium]|nr:nitrogen fixation protein NifZ [Polyangiaceae bacterium]